MTEKAEETKDDIDEAAGFAADGDDLELEPEAEGAEAQGADDSPEAPETPAIDWESRFRALEQQIAEVRNAPAPKDPEPNPEPDFWKGFQTDYPDIAEPVKKLLERQQTQFGAALADVQARAFEESMDAARPDWRELRGDDAFKSWLSANPEQQKAAQQPGVRAAMGVIRAYDAHKTEAATLQAKRQARLQSATSTPAKGSRAPSLSDSLDGWAAD